MIEALPRFCAEEVVEHAVAVDKVRYAGEAVAVAVAETRYLAEDALDLVESPTRRCAARRHGRRRRSGRARCVHENLGTNVVYEKTFTHGDVEGDFARAAHVVHAHAALAARDGVADGAGRARSATSTAPAAAWTCTRNSNMLNFAAWVLSATLRTCRPS